MTYKWYVRHALALGIVFASLAARPLAAQQKHGDVNGDGAVSALDAQAILTAVVGLPLPGGYIVANGVSVCDGRLTPGALDAQIVLSYVIGLDVSQYCVGAAFGSSATKVAISPTDSSVLINRTIKLIATLKDANGFAIKRPISWSTNAPAITALDSVKNDSIAFFRGVAPGSATITASSDGASFLTQLKVFLSYAGIVITPQRVDTLRQLNATTNFTARNRDSLGVVSGAPTGFWTVTDTTIGTVSPATASGTATFTARSMGTTYLKLVSSTNPSSMDSLALSVKFPAVASCSAASGTVHPTTTYTTAQVWDSTTNPHFVTGTQTFNSGSQLTVGPGTVVCFSSGQTMTFHAGSKMTAQGTVAKPITFTSTVPTQFWGGIQFGDGLSYTGSSTDQSVITNALFERIGSTGLSGREQHALVLDSIRVRQGNATTVRILGPGSRLSRSIVDTVGGSSFGVSVGRGTVEFTTIHLATTGSGVLLQEAGVVKNVDIVGGVTGIGSSGSVGGAKVNNVTITGATGFALDLSSYTIDSTSANVTMSGGTGGAFRGQIGNLGILYPDSLKQETLKGQGHGDTVFVTGGTLIGRTLVVRPDMPWRVTTYAYIDTLAQLAPRPGAQIRFSCCQLIFQRGGTLNAIGEPGKRIVFKPDNLVPNATLYGLEFENPGPGPTPSLAPRVTSTLSYVQIDSASGVYAYNGFGYYAAINAGDHHKLLIDSLVVRKAFTGAVYLGAPGSQLSNSRIDTTGTIESNYVSSYAAVALGDTTTIQNTLVRRSGQTGVYAPGAGVHLINTRIVGSLGVGLDVSGDLIAGDQGGVRADSANAYAFRGEIQNLAVLAPDSAAQANAFLLPGGALGNGSNILEITGGTLAGRVGTHTPNAPLVLTNIPQLRWRVTYYTYIDTLAQLAPRPGAQFRFTCCGFTFQRGGTLQAVGVAGKKIVFKPDSLLNYATFYGMEFENPGPGPTPSLAPVATSNLSYVQVDSASGVYVYNSSFGYYAALNAGDHHKLVVDSLYIRKAFTGAVYVAAPSTVLNNVRVDTTGAIESNYVSSYPAVALGDNTLIQNSRVLRSGQTGIYAPGTGARLVNTRVVGSLGVGLDAESGLLGGDLASFRADSANAYAFRGRIENLAKLAPDSTSQANAFLLQPSGNLGNSSNILEITGGTLVGTPGTHTPGSPLVLTNIPQLRWRVTYYTYVDTLAQLAPRPGAQFRFTCCGFTFQRGGTLQAVGVAVKKILFKPDSLVNNATFYGMGFENPGPGPTPSLAPVATSNLSYVQVDSASGMYVSSGFGYYAAVNAGDHHKLVVDSLYIRKAFTGAVYVATPATVLNNVRVDTTGTIESNYVSSYVAVALGDNTQLQNARVLRSGNTGVYASGAGARLTNVRIAGSLGVGLDAETGILAGDIGTLRADSANAYAFRGRIENLAVLAPDSSTQANAFLLQPSGNLGNTSNRLEISGGALRGTVGVHTDIAPLVLTAIPQLRWRVTSYTYVDTLARFAPRPSAQIRFTCCEMRFRQGGTLLAAGENGKRIGFKADSLVSNSNFAGLAFDNPGGSGTVSSTLSYVRVDSATGTYEGDGFGSYASVNAGSRHVLTIDSLWTRKSFYGAVYLAAPTSSLTNSRLDTSSTSNSSYHAVALRSGTSATNDSIHQAGQGVYVDGTGITLSGTSVVTTVQDGYTFTSQAVNGTFSFFNVFGAGGDGISISANGVQITHCTVSNGASDGIVTTSSYTGVQIHNCDITSNVGNGVTNGNTNPTYVIDAINNYWGAIDGPQGTGGDGVGANVNFVPYCSIGCALGFAPLPPTAPSTPSMPPMAYRTDLGDTSRRIRRRKRA